MRALQAATPFICQGCNSVLLAPTLREIQQQQQQQPKSIFVQPRELLKLLQSERVAPTRASRYAMRSMMLMDVDDDDVLAPAPITRQETSAIRGNAQTRVTHGTLIERS